MSEVIKGPWPDPGTPGSKSRPAAKIPGSDWATGLVQLHPAARMPSYRPLTASDQERLWHWLHLALWDPPRIYAADWGRPTDIGFVAVVDGTDVGACWLRVLPEGVGLAWVDAVTPQLGVALESAHRRQGHGRALVTRALREAWDRGLSQVSLSVHPENPAVALYEACGFRKLAERDSCHLMLARASGPTGQPK
jgi:ribosomal protein S18 acetylase RimI-like enzyme